MTIGQARDPVVIADRFWAKVNKAGPVLRKELGACWIWTGARAKSGKSVGYGIFHLMGRPVHASRAAWLVSRGVMPTLCVLHTCDGGALGCVRPEHLFEGTRQDNSRDMVTKGRGRGRIFKGEQHGCAKLTDKTVLAMRARYADGASQADIEREFSLSRGGALKIVRRITWRHLP